MYLLSRAILDELGWHFDAALTSAIASGPVELIAGDVTAAEAELRRDYDALAAMGERNYISTTAAFLAEALYRQGRDEEALAMTEQSEEIAAADDVATQYLWRSVRAKLVARRGSFAEAEALALDAIRIIEAAQDPDSQGYAYIDLAEVLRMAGRARGRDPGGRRGGRPLRSEGEHGVGGPGASSQGRDSGGACRRLNATFDTCRSRELP